MLVCLYDCAIVFVRVCVFGCVCALCLHVCLYACVCVRVLVRLRAVDRLFVLLCV